VNKIELSEFFLEKVKNGKLVKDGVMAMSKKLSDGSAEMMKQAEELVNECKMLSASDPCEAAVKIGYCLKENGEKRKLVFGF
jgi:PBP/GOBP family